MSFIALFRARAEVAHQGVSTMMSGRIARRVHAVGRHAFERFVEDRCWIGASALSYTTLVSLVPLTALALVIFSGFSVFGEVREALLNVILDNFAPSIGDQAAGWFTFVATNAGQSTAFGIASLVVTAVLLLVTIEDQLHLIFHVTLPRGWIERIVIYWTILTLGPVLAGIGLSATGSLDVLFKNLNSGHDMTAAIQGWRNALSWLPPFLIETGMIAALYTLVPNRVVRWRDSLTGAVIATALLHALKIGFVIFVSQLSSYNRMYGALAGIPIFLLWMYVFWLVLLMGAEITASLISIEPEHRPDGA